MDKMRESFEYSSLLPASLARCAWQDAIFDPDANRLALMKLNCPSWPLQRIDIEVHRNTTFELIAEDLRPYLNYAGFDPNFVIGPYDDSLNFHSPNETGLHIVWLDYDRYQKSMGQEEFVPWLKNRLESLRNATVGPIICANSADAALNVEIAEVENQIPGLKVFDVAGAVAALGGEAFDGRMKTLGAMEFSAKGSIAIAKHLGLNWIPAALRPRLKALAVDLDNTLYSGVVGEDAPRGLQLRAPYRALQERLKMLKSQGLFLALVSKNNPDDVEALFAERNDFPLRPDDFSAMAVGWHSKVDGIKSVAAQLRIGIDSILFIDDNMGELNEVSLSLPEVELLHASTPELVERALTFFPGLAQWIENREDLLRGTDLAMAERRNKEIATLKDPFAYLKSLETQLLFRIDQRDDESRIYDLSAKTNQFNLALQRFSQSTVASWMEASNKMVLTVSLKDRLSDSGIIAALFFRFKDQTLHVEEVCISCRALGRRLEDFMIFKAIYLAAERFAFKEVSFLYCNGARNEPALNWLRNASAKTLEREGWITMGLPDLQELPVDMQVVWFDV